MEWGVTQDVGIAKAGARASGAVTLFTVTIFASALLLFLVQPMFAKLALPRLGGSAAVWSVALVFFQSVLLLGYAYSHLLISRVGIRRGVIMHGLVMAAALVSLPIGISESWGAPPENDPALWLIALLAVSIGLPFFAISANAPLLQSWFARMGHPRSDDPYFLYAGSNAGSFAALLAYPFLIEPLVGLRPQSWLWSVAYVGLIGLVMCCGYLAVRAAPGWAVTTQGRGVGGPLGLRTTLTWIALAAVPSGLLVATTAHIVTDLVSAPFLWVLPLGLYLLTFVIAFQARPLIPHAALMDRMGTLVAPLCVIALLPVFLLPLLALQLIAVFLLMMLCHGELARLRPPAARLTEFYFLMSLGGVIGGVFASLIAPNVFSSVAEYPGLIVAAFLVVAMSASAGKAIPGRRMLLALAATAVFVGLAWMSGGSAGLPSRIGLGFALVMVLTLFWLLRNQPVGLAVVLVGVAVSVPLSFRKTEALAQTRSFYGVIAVREGASGRSHVLSHGSTLHGLQMFADAQGRPLPGPTRAQAYYYPEGPIGSAVGKLRAARGGLGRVALVGLGAGSMMCLKAPGEDWRFYEIDPEMVRIATDERYFTFLRDCGPPEEIVIGDGRLRLQEVPDGAYDLIVLDAFSSDSVPAHLLTLEALDLYLAKLKPGGLVVFHISNRYMELSGVVEGAARARGLEAWHSVRDGKAWAPDPDRGDVAGIVAVVGKTPGTLGVFDADPKWKRAAPGEAAEPWTDDYSNVLGAMWRFKRRQP